MIASITVVGQFPDGIDLHIRNLKWFLQNTDYHIYIITTTNVKIDDPKVTLITRPNDRDVFTPTPGTAFINFWKWFPSIIEYYQIDPDWFLFMEQDIWFFEQFDCCPSISKTIKSYFQLRSPYHNVMVDDKLLSQRVWEGAHLINKEVIHHAINFNINFSYYKTSFLDRNRVHYERQFGGKISLSQCKEGDTMDEFTLYCALEERIQWEETNKAVHLRGPETVHRHHPHIYNGCSQEELYKLSGKIWYIDIYMAIAMFYIAGNWKNGNINWKVKDQTKRDLNKVRISACHWMTKEQNQRLEQICSAINI